jgi:hypothetical protein
LEGTRRRHEVHALDTYELVRRSVLLEEMSKREASRQYGVNRRTVTKMAENPIPPGYRLKEPRKKPKMEGFEAKIDELLNGDENEPRKQLRTAFNIFETLRDKHGYEGGYTQVRIYVAERKARQREAFVPLAHLPGEAQADFLEAAPGDRGRSDESSHFPDGPSSFGSLVHAGLSTREFGELRRRQRGRVQVFGRRSDSHRQGQPGLRGEEGNRSDERENPRTGPPRFRSFGPRFCLKPLMRRPPRETRKARWKKRWEL